MSKAKKIGILTLGQGVNTMVNILFLPYMSRVLDYYDYGSYGQTLLVISFTGVLFSAGLSKIIFVYLSNNENKENILTSNIIAGLILSLIGVLLIFLNAELIAFKMENIKLKPLLLIYCFNLLFFIPNQSFNSFLIYTNRVKTSIIIIVLGNLIKTLLVVLAIQIYKSINLALLGIVISQFLVFCANIFISRKNLSLNYKKKLIFDQIKKGYPLGLTSIIGTAILYTDAVMISKLSGIKSYSIYRNGAFEVPLISTIYTSVAAIVLPEVSKLFSKKEYYKIATLKKKVIMNSIFIIYPVFVFICFNSIEFITLYLGEKYKMSAYVFFIFNFTLLIRVNDYSDVLISANKTFKILQYYILALIINIILNYILILNLGIKGAAISTVASISLLAFLQLRTTLKIIKTRFTDLINLKQLFYFLAFSFFIAWILDTSLTFFIKNMAIKLLSFFILFFIFISIFLSKVKYIDRNLFLQLLPSTFKSQLAKYGIM